ncbi:MAG: carbohydrate ABC transporter permease [Acutalibacteraceae bacterium]
MAKYKRVVLSRSRGGTVAIFIFLILVSIFMMFPLYYSVIQSLKPIDEIFIYPPRFTVHRPTLENFKQVYNLSGNLSVPFTRYLFNSLFVTIVGTLLYLVLASLAGYSLAKGKYKGVGVLYTFIVLALLFRPEVTAIPVYYIVSKLGIIDTYWALLITPLGGTMGVFLIRQFVISSIPDATLEAARIDGAGELRIFRTIVLPGIKPAIMTVMIFTFQSLWNSSGGKQYIFSESLKELPTVLSTIVAGGIARQGAGAAVSVIMMIPPIAVFLWSQRSVMETMTHSGLK